MKKSRKVRLSKEQANFLCVLDDIRFIGFVQNLFDHRSVRGLEQRGLIEFVMGDASNFTDHQYNKYVSVYHLTPAGEEMANKLKSGEFYI